MRAAPEGRRRRSSPGTDPIAARRNAWPGQHPGPKPHGAMLTRERPESVGVAGEGFDSPISSFRWGLPLDESCHGIWSLLGENLPSNLLIDNRGPEDHHGNSSPGKSSRWRRSLARSRDTDRPRSPRRTPTHVERVESPGSAQGRRRRREWSPPTLASPNRRLWSRARVWR